MLEIFQYPFMIRAFVAGLSIALISPLIGSFLVMRKFSLFADSLAHVAFAGVAIGLATRTYPVITSVLACVIAAIIIERLRMNRRVYSDSALSLFLSGSLAVALTIISLSNGLNASVFSYLFGSVIAVDSVDVVIISTLGLVVMSLIFLFYKELFYISFDEESARVSGIKVSAINLLFMIMAAITVALSMRVVGIMMVGALMVIPVLSALQISHSFKGTMGYGVLFSLFSVLGGLFLSYYIQIVAGGAIVLCALLIFSVVYFFGKFRKGP